MEQMANGVADGELFGMRVEPALFQRLDKISLHLIVIESAGEKLYSA